jgi:hypothetical protein
MSVPIIKISNITTELDQFTDEPGDVLTSGAGILMIARQSRHVQTARVLDGLDRGS